ncbi:MAG: Crp/Fnr family transcriptional regulator [Proteobacteria bacterium]|nr:Crp/Fnr family transcriptional regulator [Pseudomonadota bacterium]
MSAISVPGSGLTPAEWAIVRRCPLLLALPEEEAARLLGGHRPVVYEPGQNIFTQGDDARAFFVVVEGWVKVFRLTPDGDEAVVSVFTTGESFAEPVMFLGGRYPVSAAAASRVRLARIEAADFSAMIMARPELSTAMLAAIARHTQQLSDEIMGLKLLGAPRRLADFLVKLAPDGAKSAAVTLPHEKSLLAGRLGMTPESLSRGLASLRQLGLKVERDVIEIPDVAALSAYSRIVGRGAKRRA